VTAKVSFLPNVTRCETCEVGVACMVADQVWLCQTCAEVLGAVTTSMQMSTPVSEVAPQPAGGPPSLLDVINTVLRGVK
jgi:hypothetical protein